MLDATQRAELDCAEWEESKRQDEATALRKSVHDLSRLLANALTVMDLTREYHPPECKCDDCGFMRRCGKAIEKGEEVLG